MLTAIAAILITTFPLQEVPLVRYERMTRGINLTGMWSSSSEYSLERLNSWARREDYDQLAAAGFRHVRIPLNPESLWDGREPARLDSRKLNLLTKQINELVERRLAVILSIAPIGFEKPFATKTSEQKRFRSFLTALATTTLSKTDPDWVYIEPVDYPQQDSVANWSKMLGELMEILREDLPRHTMIVSGPGDAPDELLQMKPFENKNVVYNFHFYEPFAFTLQNVGSAAGPSRFLRNVPYPSTPQKIGPLLREQENEAAKKMLDTYARERWDATVIAKRIIPVGDWAKKHKVFITCNEFGAYSVGVPPDSRTRWTRDVVHALVDQKIGWTFRDYVGGFGIAKGAPGNRMLDNEMLRMLGVQ